MAINFWKRFEALIKPEAMTIVTILAIHADGTCTAETIGGGTVRLRSGSIDLAIGDKAFAVGGAISDKAQNLPYYEIEV